MATQNRTNTQRNTYRVNQNVTYLYGSAAPQYGAQPQRRSTGEQVRPVSTGTQKKQAVKAKPSPVNMPLFLLSLVAFAAIGIMVIQYISLSSEISVLSSNITSLESQINTLQEENSEYYGRIMSSIDLNEVREVAIMDLGMEYATEGQIITYDSQIDDYVEQNRVIKD